MNKWDIFFKEKIIKIFTDKKTIIDIGGGLRILKNKGNRYDPSREWVRPFLNKVQYKIMDPSADYSPDIIGDIHNLPFENNSQDAIICLAVLEHVEDPKKAIQEIYRVLKIDGYCFIYAPFLFYYHAEKGYYKDYWRFTKDGLELLFKDFSQIEMEPVRGRLGTWLHLSPFGRVKLFAKLADWLDAITNGFNSRQVSGYNVFLVK